MFSVQIHCLNQVWIIEFQFPKIYIDLGPVWLDQNWNRFQNPVRLFRPDFPKPNPDSWNLETSPGAGFFGFKMADGDGQVSVETSDNLFWQSTVHNFTIKS